MIRRVLPLAALAVIAAIATPWPAVAAPTTRPTAPTVALQAGGIVSYGDPVTGALEPLAPDVTGGEQLHPSWSPNGRKVAFAVDDADGSRDLWITDVPGGPARRVVDCVSPRCGFTDDPAWSPDGRSLAFEQVLRAADDDGIPTLEVLDLTTLRQRTVASFPADFTPYTPSWGPGGKALLYELDRFASTRWDESEIRNIRIQTVDLRSRRKQTLTDPAKNAQIPDWNAKDGRIVYVQPLDQAQGFFGPLDLVVIDRSGRHFATRVGAGGERALQPSWTPDGRSIVFVFEHELFDSRIAFLDPATGRITRTTTFGTHPRVRPHR